MTYNLLSLVASLANSRLRKMRKLPSSDSAGLGNTSPARRRVLRELVLSLPVGAIVVLAVAFLLVGLQTQALFAAVVFYFVGSMLMIHLFRRGFPHTQLGLGNFITLGRFVLVSALFSVVFGLANPWLIIFISVFALVLDGFDGFFARRAGKVSEFGARLDMEVDSALAAVLALSLWSSGLVGIEILLLAIPRYVFAFAANIFPWMTSPLPYSLARRVISVIQIASLIGLHAPFLPEALIAPVALIVIGLLIWSFGRDMIWLWRNRK